MRYEVIELKSKTTLRGYGVWDTKADCLANAYMFIDYAKAVAKETATKFAAQKNGG